jgi:hypothetical protein
MEVYYRKIDFNHEKITTKHYHFYAIGIDMFQAKDIFRVNKHINKTCFLCGYKFKDDDFLSLLYSDKSTSVNQLICQYCADDFK